MKKIWTFALRIGSICLPYARHYKPRLVYFFTPFPKAIYVLWPFALCTAWIQERLLIKSALWWRAYGICYALICVKLKGCNFCCWSCLVSQMATISRGQKLQAFFEKFLLTGTFVSKTAQPFKKHIPAQSHNCTILQNTNPLTSLNQWQAAYQGCFWAEMWFVQRCIEFQSSFSDFLMGREHIDFTIFC